MVAWRGTFTPQHLQSRRKTYTKKLWRNSRRLLVLCYSGATNTHLVIVNGAGQVLGRAKGQGSNAWVRNVLLVDAALQCSLNEHPLPFTNTYTHS